MKKNAIYMYYDVNIGEFCLCFCFVISSFLIQLFMLCLHVYGEYPYVFGIKLFAIEHRY